MQSIRRATTGAVMALILLAVPSNAEAATAISVPANLQARAELMCARIPNLLARTDAQISRLPAGPETRGSIAWVKSRAQAASDRNRAQLATELNNRADVLTQKLALLPNQKAALQKAQQTCQDAGIAS